MSMLSTSLPTSSLLFKNINWLVDFWRVIGLVFRLLKMQDTDMGKGVKSASRLECK